AGPGLAAVAGAAAADLTCEGREDAHAGRAHGVAQRDAGAVHVRALEVGLAEAPFAGDRQRLRGEGLVELDEVEVLDPQTGAVQRDLGRGDRADAHRARRDARHAPADDADERLEAQLLRLRAGRDDRGCRTVVLTGGVARGDGRVLIDLRAHRLEPAQRLEVGGRADVLVERDLLLRLLARRGDRDRDDLLREH